MMKGSSHAAATRQKEMTERQCQVGVFIGVDGDGGTGLEKLQCCEKDARDMAKRFQELWSTSRNAKGDRIESHTLILTSRGLEHWQSSGQQDPSMQDPSMQIKPESFKLVMDKAYDKLNGNSLLVVYFSGHGLHDGTEMSLGMGGSLPRSRVLEQLHQSSARQKVLLLDACHSGGLRLRHPSTKQLKAESAEGTVVLSACGVDQRTPASDQNSRFTALLLDALRSAGERQEGKRLIDCHSVHQHISESNEFVTAEGEPVAKPSDGVYEKLSPALSAFAANGPGVCLATVDDP
jgi:hypothetical protein